MTWPEIVAWVHAVAPHMARSDRSLQTYVRQWDVVGKVQRAKANGTLEAILASRDHRRDL